MINFVILCGGSGSRLWPKSREKLPKQFLKVTNDQTMLQNTISRILKIQSIIKNGEYKIVIICNKDHFHIVKNQIHELNLHCNVSIISEPKGRDSAPPICLASLISSEDDYSFIMPCDHVLDDDSFAQTCLNSITYLEESIVTFGIKPSYIETGYGYIKTNENNETIDFIEKPNYLSAKKYFEDSNYLWNAGIFAFKNKNMKLCFDNYAADILNNCKETLENSLFKESNISISSHDYKYEYIELANEPFVNCRSISIDYAIMEPLCKDFSSNIKKITIPYNFHWNDIGSFSALYNELEKDASGNVFVFNGNGNVTCIETKNCFIDSKKPIVATIDIENLVIIDTEDVLLICNKDNTQKVKNIVNIFKEKKAPQLLFHQTVLRPWGSYTILDGDDNSGFKVKRIEVLPGKRLSLQSHEFRSEHWVVSKGTAKAIVGEKEYILNSNDHIYIPLKTIHRIENIGTNMLEFIETQIGNYLGEDDIVRYHEDF